MALSSNNLCSSATKTVICPKTTTILGWIWTNGSISASQHRISTLAAYSPPETVHGLRSFLGAYKVLSRVIPNCSQLLSKLEDSIAGLQSKDQVNWTDELLCLYKKAQDALHTCRSIVLPRAEDQLWIVTDGSVSKHGIGATLYVSRHSKLFLAGYFSAKLRKHQVTWLPCEIEALCIAASVKHYSPYIIRSHQIASVLTDSKPCVQAFKKLCRGEFSASPRVTSFLSTVSRFQVNLKHLAGSANVPSDFASRNALPCTADNCQICSFISLTENSVVRALSVQDITSGAHRLPFTTRSAWIQTQAECPDLRRVHSHLKQGTRPSRKITNVRDVKRYLNTVTIAKDGLLVVQQTQALASPRELIVVPREVLDGLLVALHLKLSHPSKHQLKQVVKRYFFALDIDKTLDSVSSTCHTCASLQKLPSALMEQSSEDPPDVIGVSFAADVLKRCKQLILVYRETASSYTTACFIDNEQRSTLRDGLIRLSLELRPLDGPPALIRVDPASGFAALRNDDVLNQLHLCVEIGRVKNINKNPVAEKAIAELEDELLKQEPHGGPISQLCLALSIARLNSRIRNRGLSSREIWTHRNQYSNEQIPIIDRDLISEQQSQRLNNHSHSANSKNYNKHVADTTSIKVGDLVYVRSDRNKTCSRDRYLVIGVMDSWCFIRKFSGSQLRSMSYKVKLNECYKVPFYKSPDISLGNKRYTDTCTDEDPTTAVETYPTQPIPPAPPIAPPVLTLPLEQPPESDIAVSLNEDDVTAVEPRRSTRTRLPPTYLQDYVTD